MTEGKIFEILRLSVKWLHLVHPEPFKFQFNVLKKYMFDFPCLMLIFLLTETLYDSCRVLAPEDHVYLFNYFCFTSPELLTHN